MKKHGESVKWKWQEKTELLVGKPVPVQFVHHKSHVDRHEIEGGAPFLDAGE
jgi:hypothetical protein